MLFAGYVLCIVERSDESNPEFAVEYEGSQGADEVVDDDEMTAGPEICTFSLMRIMLKIIL